MNSRHPFASIVFLIGMGASFTSEASRSVETLLIKRADDSDIKAYVQRDASVSRQGILLVLQGSQCMDVSPGGADHLGFDPPDALARLDIQKYGIDEQVNGNDGKSCPPTYLANNTIHQRVSDVLAVVSTLRSKASWWNGQIFLMGTSEGATVAAMVGPLMPETQGIVLINGSIGRPFREGWADAMAASVIKAGASESDVQAVRNEAEATWTRARLEPRSDVEVFGVGNTLKWWASIIDLRPSNHLLMSDAPILLMQSENDEMTPTSSARSVVDQFKALGKTNLTYVELPGLNHGLRKADGTPGWEPVMQNVYRWLENTGSEQ